MFEGHDQAIQELLAAHRLIEPAALRPVPDVRRTRPGQSIRFPPLRAVAGQWECVVAFAGGIARRAEPLGRRGVWIRRSPRARDLGGRSVQPESRAIRARERHPAGGGGPRTAQRLIRQHYGEDEASLEEAIPRARLGYPLRAL